MPNPGWTEDTARTLTHGWMAHLGYTAEEIALSDQPREHNRGGQNVDLGYCCEVTEHGWQCWDENGEPAHQVHDALDEVAEQVVFMLEQLADTGLLVVARTRAALRVVHAATEARDALAALLDSVDVTRPGVDLSMTEPAKRQRAAYKALWAAVDEWRQRS